MAKRAGIVRIDPVFLAELLHFPPGHEIVAVRESSIVFDGTLEFKVEGPTMPEVRYGEPLVQVGFEISIELSKELVPEKKVTGAFRSP